MPKGFEVHVQAAIYRLALQQLWRGKLGRFLDFLFPRQTLFIKKLFITHDCTYFEVKKNFIILN